MKILECITDVWFAWILVAPPATRITGLVLDEEPRAMGTKVLPEQRKRPPHDIDCSFTG